MAFSSHLRAEATLFETSFETNPTTDGWVTEGDDLSSTYSKNWKWTSSSESVSSGSDYSSNKSHKYVYISPVIVIDQRGGDFSFDYSMEEDSQFSVYVLVNGSSSYMDNPNAAFELRKSLPMTSGFSTIEASLVSYAGQSIRLAFVHENSAGKVTIDNVVIEKTPLCPPAKNITLNNLQSTSVVLNWVNATTDSYKLMICSEPQTTPSVPDVNQVISTTDINSVNNSYTVDGLTAGSTYYFYLRANCISSAHGMGDWSEVVKCSTPCIAQATPYSIDFDSYSLGDNPSCWVPISTCNEQPAVYTDEELESPCYSIPITSSKDAMIILPMFSSNAEELMVTMRIKASSENQQLSVGLTNDITDASAFLTCTTQELTEEWGTYTFFLKNSYYTGPNYYVALYAPSGQTESASPIYQFIDDIQIVSAPDCLYPLKLNASKLSDSSVTLAWEDKNTSSHSFTVEYTQNGVTQTVDAPSSPFTVTGLIENTDYTIKVRTNCTSTTYSQYTESINIHTYCTPIVLSQSSDVYTDDFESLADSKWLFLNDNQENFWTIGTAIFKDGTHSMYATSDQLLKPFQLVTSKDSYSYAYCDFDFSETGQYKISYDWHGNGGYTAYAKVVMLPVDYPLSNGESWGSVPSQATRLVGDESYLSSSTPSWETEENFIDIKTPGLKRIVLYWHNAGSARNDASVALDNFKIKPIPCPKSSNLDFAGSTTTTASFKWEGSSAKYTLKLFTQAHALDSISLITTGAITASNIVGNQGTVTGLSEASHYVAYLQGNCTTTDDSEWIGPIEFNTQCSAIDLPYESDFNSDPLGYAPHCWNILTESTLRYPSVEVSSNYALTLNNTPYLCFETSTIYPIYAVFPEFKDHEIDELLLEFDTKFSSYYYAGDFEVGYMMDISDRTTFTMVHTISSTTSLEHHKLDMSTYTIPDGAQLAIKYTTGEDDYYGSSYVAGIDNILITVRPDCMPIENLLMGSATSNSIAMTWTSETGNYNIEYGPKDFVVGTGTLVNVADNNYTITGLTPLTEYTVRVQANCPSSLSTWKEFTTHTTAPPESGNAYLCDFEDDTQRISWQFANDEDQNGWEVGDKVAKDGTHSLYIVNTTQSLGYTNGEESDSWVYKTFTCLPGEYVVGFDWLCNGESTYDYLQAVVTPEDAPIVGGSRCSMSKTFIPDGWITFEGSKNYLNLKTEWQHQEIHFNVSETKNVNLAFYWRNDGSGGSNPGAQIDNVSFTRLACGKVVEFTQSTLTSYSAKVLWQSDVVDHYKVRVSTQTIPENQLDTVVRHIVYASNVQTVSEVDLVGLLPNTTYNLYVKNICSASDSSQWSDAYTFVTPCAIQSVPYMTSFDNDVKNNLPACWTNLGDVEAEVYSYTKHGDSGNSFAIKPGEGETAQLVSPQLELVNDISEYQVSFYAYLYNSKNDADVHMSFGQMDDLEDNTTFSELTSTITLSHAQKGEWKRFVIPFTHPLDIITGQAKVLTPEQYFVLNVPGECKIYIDDFKIEDKASCSEPYAFDISSISSVGCTFKWMGSASKYEVSILDQDIPGATVQKIITSKDSLVLNTLNPHTNYALRVRAICGANDTSLWSDVQSFLTDCALETLPFVETFDVLNNSIPICWEQSGGYISWKSINVNDGQKHAVGFGSSYSSISTDISKTLSSYTIDLKTVNKALLNFESWMSYDNYMQLSVLVSCESEALNDTIAEYTQMGFFDKNQLDLSSYVGKEIQIHFVALLQDGLPQNNYICIDNVEVLEEQYVAMPTRVSIDHITQNSVEVHVAANPKVTSYNVYVIPESESLDFAKHTPTVMNHSTSVVVSGLSGSTNYKVYVQAVVGSAHSLCSDAIVFATDCEDAILPLFETFDDSQKRLPLCWRDTGLVDISTYHAASGTQSLRLQSNAVYISPRLVEDVNTMELFANIYSSAAIEVGVCSDPEQLASTYTVVSTLTPATNFDTQYNVDFTNIPLGNHYIVIVAPAATSYAYIDNLQIVESSDCSQPSTVELISMTDESAGFTISDPTASRFDVAYGPSESFSLNGITPQIVGSNSSVSITGLSASTSYTMYVRSNCSADSHSAWFGPVEFTTDCGPYTLVEGQTKLEDLSEFRDASVDASTLPHCWSSINSSNTRITPYVYVRSDRDPYTYDYYEDIKISANSTDSIYLVMQSLSNSLSDVELSMKILSEFSTGYESVKMEIGVMSDGHNKDSFIPIDQVDISKVGNYYAYYYTLDMRYAAIPSTHHTIAIRLSGASSALILDNIKLKLIDGCGIPKNIQATEITKSSANIALDCVHSASRYEVIISNKEAAYCDTISDLVPGTKLALTNLLPSSTYTVKARSFCPNNAIEDTTAWSDDYQFYTLQNPHAVPYVCDFETQAENANWTSMHSGLVNHWTINSAYAKEGSSSMFVSNDGIHATYENDYTFIWAYRLLTLDRANYDVSCYAKVGGGASDYLRIFLIPEAITLKSGNYNNTNCDIYSGMELASNKVPDGFIEITNSSFKSSDWTEIFKMVTVENAGNYRLAFLWRNSNYSGTPPGAIVDSIVVKENNCPIPKDLAVVDCTFESVKVTANIALGTSFDQIRYVVIPKDSILNESNIVSQTVGNMGDTVEIMHLLPNTFYKVYAAKVCGSDYSAYTDFEEFTTKQQPASLPYGCGFEDSEKESNQWMTINDKNNIWVRDTAVHFAGEKALYITDDNGVSNSYTSFYSSHRSYVYRAMYLEIGEYDYSFNWKSYGDTSSDYGLMYVIPDGDGLPEKGSLNIGSHSLSIYGDIPDTWYRSIVLHRSKTWREEKSSFIISKAGVYNVLFLWSNNVSTDYNPPLAVDNLSITQRTCSKVTANVSEVTSNSALLSWISTSPRVHTYLYEDDSNTLVKDTILTEDYIAYSGLESNTSYKFVVRSLCSENDSSELSDAVLFTTDCMIRKAPFSNDFNSNPLDLDCWGSYRYLIDSDTTVFSELIPASSTWAKRNADGESQHLYVNIYGTDKKEWLVSPSIEVSPNDILKFEVAFTDFYDMKSPKLVGNDDVFAVMISRDNGTTWTSLQTWDQKAATKEKLEDLSIDFTTKTFALTDQPLDTIKFAFYAASSVRNADNNIRVDNVKVTCMGDTVTISDEICSGYPYTLNGFNIPKEEVHTGRFIKLVQGMSEGECDHVKILDLKVNNSYDLNISDVICQGQSYNFGEYNLTIAGDYINTLVASTGCDSLVHLHLEVVSLEVTKDTILCEGQTLNFGGSIITTSGSYEETVVNSQGCDSVTHLNVTVIPTQVSVYDTICEGDYYALGTQKITHTGVYHATLRNQFNCDSIVTLNLKVNQRDSLMKDQFCEGSTYNFRGLIVSKAGVYTDTIHNFHGTGCDRVYKLSLFETKPDTVYISDQFCEGDLSYNNYGFGIDNPQTKDYVSRKQSAVTGCDSITILQLSEIATVNTKIAYSLCDGDFYNWGGKDYGTEGVYTHTFESAAGCDSIVEMTLNVNPTYELDVNDTIQYSELPYVNLDLKVPAGTSPGDYQFQANGKTRLGCDSLINLDLHIRDNVGLDAVTMNELILYPTSVKSGGMVYIHTDFTTNDKEGMSIQLYNTVGKVIKQYIPQNGIMKVEMPRVSGVYYMHINLNDGRSYVGKVIVY